MKHVFFFKLLSMMMMMMMEWNGMETDEGVPSRTAPHNRGSR